MSPAPGEPWPDMHLGDGAYLSHDGWHIWLAANHHRNKVIALEPMVFAALIREVMRHPGPHRDELVAIVSRHKNENEEPPP